MERNPYAPPVSTVADPVEVRAERPKEVTLAVKLLWASFFLGLAGVFFQPVMYNGTTPKAGAQWIGVVIGMAVVFGIWAWVITKIAKGLNWARIVFLVLAIFGTVVTILMAPTAIALYKARPLSGVISVVNFVLELYTVYLLLTASARAWFKQPPP